MRKIKSQASTSYVWKPAIIQRPGRWQSSDNDRECVYTRIVWISEDQKTHKVEEGNMDIQTLTECFKWCTILNGGIFIIWSGLTLFAPNWLYRIQSRWFSISRETFTVAIYSFLGLFKIIFLFFNVVPFVALLIIG